MVPTRYREEIHILCAGNLVITVSPWDKCLFLMPFPAYEAVEATVNKLPTNHPQSRVIQRLLVGHAHEFEMDGQGRVLLPDVHRKFAALEKQIVLLGQGAKFEIWDEDTFSTKRDQWQADETLTNYVGDQVPQLGMLSF